MPPPPPAPAFRVTACVADHIGDRGDQQDRVSLITSARRPGCLLALVADGMGGRTGGRLASDQVVATVRARFDEAPEPGMDERELLRQMALEAHSVVKLTAIASEKEPHSTIVALLLQRSHAVWMHAGDSRLYLFRDGALLRKTIDHSYGTRVTHEGELVEAGPESDRFKNVLFSAIGIGHELRLEFDRVDDLRAGDCFVLSSDGLWAHFTTEEVGRLVHESAAREAAERLVALARERAGGRGDNLSLAIVKLEAA